MNSKKVIGLLPFLIFSFLVKAGNPQNDKPRVHYKYLLYLPELYDSVKKDFPLLIYLHGASVRGNEIDRIKRYGLPFMVEKGEKFDFIIVSPQCPASKSWSSDNWFEPLYEELMAKYRIDSNRVYITGMSLGGYGAWNTAMDYPGKFAAVIPLCGGGDVNKVCNLSSVPVWAFHGTADTLVPFNETEKLVDALEKCNGDVKFSRLKGKGHSIYWVYEDRKIYDWMLLQKKSSSASGFSQK